MFIQTLAVSFGFPYMGRDFDVLSSLRLIIYLKLGVFVSRILSGTTQYYNPYTVRVNIELNRSFLCNCFLLSREGSSIITFTYLYNQPSRCMRQVHRGARRTACVTVKNRGSYLWPKLVKRPISVPNWIVWTRRKRTSLPVTQENPYGTRAYSFNLLFVLQPVWTYPDSLKTNLCSLLELTLPVYHSTLILHRHDYLLLPAPLTIDYKTLKNKRFLLCLYQVHYNIPYPCISVSAVLRLLFLLMIYSVQFIFCFTTRLDLLR